MAGDVNSPHWQALLDLGEDDLLRPGDVQSVIGIDDDESKGRSRCVGLFSLSGGRYAYVVGDECAACVILGPNRGQIEALIHTEGHAARLGLGGPP